MNKMKLLVAMRDMAEEYGMDPTTATIEQLSDKLLLDYASEITGKREVE